MINHALSIPNRIYFMFILGMLDVLVIFVMQSFEQSLKPYSIIAFEFAATPERAHLMVDAWRENGVLNTIFFLIGFDYLFMITYSAFLWLACLNIALGASERISKWLVLLAWMQPVAALLDAVENLSLYQTAMGSWNPIWTTLSVLCATPKFLIVFLALLVCLSSLVSSLVHLKWPTNKL